MDQEKIVIIGGGQASASCALRLRENGFAGPLTILCGERSAPYQRPPLSKAYLLGKVDAVSMLVRPADIYRQKNIDLRLGVQADDIDRDLGQVRLSDGTTLAYDRLVLATGARPNCLPQDICGELAGVHTLRTLDDIDAIRPDLVAGRRLVVVGAGYIGLEVAAVAIQSGLAVTVLEAAPRVLARVTSARTSDLVTALHRAHGCTILTDVRLTGLTDTGGRVNAAVLADGTTLPCDIVVVGIGVRPETGLAERAGLTTQNGIMVDAFGRSSDLRIWAIGDCANFPHGGGRMRLESVGHAIAQAEIVADNLTGSQTPYKAEPWFWSDQYDTKLQIAGLAAPDDTAVVRRSSDRVVSIWYFRDGRMVAVDAFNDPRSHMIARRLLAAGASVTEDQAADTTLDLRVLMNGGQHARPAFSN